MKHFIQAHFLALAFGLALTAPAIVHAQGEQAADATAPADEASPEASEAAGEAEVVADVEAETDEAPAVASSTVTPLKAVIVAVKGLVQFRPSSEADWQKATVGQEVPIGAEIRTGLRSQVRFDIISANPEEPPHQVSIDRLGVIALLEALEDNGKINTELGMKYGRANYKVEAGSLEHESRIRAPGSTLALRSTDGQLTYDAAFGSNVVVYNSPNSSLRTTRRNLTVPVNNGQIGEDNEGAADSALGDSVVDGTLASDITGEDTEFVNTLPGYGDILVQNDLQDVIKQNNPGGGSSTNIPTYDVLAGASFLDLLIFDPSPDSDMVSVFLSSPNDTEPLLINSFTLQSEGSAGGSGTINLTNLGNDEHTLIVRNDNNVNNQPNTATIKVLTGPQAGQLFDFTTFNPGDEASIKIQGGTGATSTPSSGGAGGSF